MQKLEVAYMTIKDYTEYKEAEILRLYAEEAGLPIRMLRIRCGKVLKTRC